MLCCNQFAMACYRHLKMVRAFCLLTGFFTLVFFHSASAQTRPVSYDTLQSGLYFFSSRNRSQLFIEGQRNAYFNPSRPTLLFLHGWQNGVVFEGGRESFLTDGLVGAPAGIDMARLWQNAGYNVAIFYWTQYADEPEVTDAEDKLWSVNGQQGMRWLSSDCNQRYREQCYREGSSTKSVSDLFVDTYLAAFSNAEPVRLAGHSLGAQLAIIGAQKILRLANAGRINASQVPHRLALLDPAFLRGRRDYLNGRTTGQQASLYVDELKADGVVIEAYRSSLTTNNGAIGDANEALLRKVAFSELRSWYLYAWQVAAKHRVAHWWYLTSIAAGELPVENDEVPALSAAADRLIVDFWMNSAQSLDQTEGRYTERVDDDAFTASGR